jgi:hypothetical protein
MVLKDLIVDHKQISEGLLENILRGKVELIKEGEGVNLTEEGNSFPNRIRVLLYLCGKKAWELLTSKEIRVSIKELERDLGIKGNTLRPILKSFKDSYQAEAEKGKYRILPKGVFELEKELQRKYGKKERVLKPYSKKSELSRKISKSEFIRKLYDEGFFKEPKKMSDVLCELKKLGIHIKLSSLPSYLLPLVRKGKLTREQITRGKRKIWVYKSIAQ